MYIPTLTALSLVLTALAAPTQDAVPSLSTDTASKIERRNNKRIFIGRWSNGALAEPAPEFAVERDGDTILSLGIDAAVADGKRFKAGEMVWEGVKGVWRYTADCMIKVFPGELTNDPSSFWIGVGDAYLNACGKKGGVAILCGDVPAKLPGRSSKC